jgi:ribosomal protein S21
MHKHKENKLRPIEVVVENNDVDRAYRKLMRLMQKERVFDDIRKRRDRILGR